MLLISWAAEQLLTFQGGLCFMQFFLLNFAMFQKDFKIYFLIYNFSEAIN
jgi:hypothetical protein